MHSQDRERTPTRLSAAVFAAKAALLQCQRGLSNLLSGISRHPQPRNSDLTTEVARSTTALWTDPAPTEMWYQRGKVQNLRVASARLDRTVIPAGEVFSFWAQVGRASRIKGYTRGRMLQEGCLIPAIGGGLCQLSNALYQVALSAGCEIVERHAHSRIVPGSATASQRDATVAWNYIDLRFRARQDWRLEVRLSTNDLNVALFSKAQVGPGADRIAEGKQSLKQSAQHNTLPIFNDHACESCGQVTCFRSDGHAAHHRSRSRKAFLLDSAWPEFARYVEASHGEHDTLSIPLDGVRWSRRQYAWHTQGFARVHTAQIATLLRSIRSRHQAAQGAARQRALLQSSRELADRLAQCLDEQTDEVCVSQNLLPFLWDSGVLGGRRVSVLCTQLPLRDLHAALDQAFRLHPESRTLNDFRAEDWLVGAETEALQNAERIITPHCQVAALFPLKSQLLDWEMPEPSSRPANQRPSGPPSILFPCSTLGRKGAYELREALRGVNARLLLGGAVIEDINFWNGFNVAQATPAQLHEAMLVVQPSIVESQPRALLRALANGIPVITAECSGLPPMTGLCFIQPMDVAALREAILARL